MTHNQRPIRERIDRFEAGATALRACVEGLTTADLDAKPGPGAWSLRELVAHVLDSDLVAQDRMRRIIGMERPLLLAYDENAYIERMPYASLDPNLVCDVLESSRRLVAQILRALPESAFERDGVHNERGILTLGQLVDDYTHHLEHHLEFARQKRERLGKPLKA